MSEEKEEPHGDQYSEDSESADLLPDLHPHSGGGSRPGGEEADRGTWTKVFAVRFLARCRTRSTVPASGVKVRAFAACARRPFLGYSNWDYETKTASQARAGRSAGNSGEGEALHFERPVQENREMHCMRSRSVGGPARAALLGLSPSQDQCVAGQRAADACPRIGS
jgi:hypothetical protein